MQTIEVQCVPPYLVMIGNRIVHNIRECLSLAKYSGGCVVCDEAVSQEYGDLIRSSLPNGFHFISVQGGEATKNVDTLCFLWGEFLRIGLDRKGVVVNFGGGAILDVAGFAASTYMRGISFIHVPTTLLSQVDASIGGKTGLNIHGVKNLVGAFQQPSGVCIDVNFLSSLNDRELRSGVAEMIKHGIMFDTKYFNALELFPWSRLRLEVSQLSEIIYSSCQIKARIVAEDPQEAGIRKALNFGHTVGHAIEILSYELEKPLTHGEAVALGMIAETVMAVKEKLCGSEVYDRLGQILSCVGLPIRWDASVSCSAIFDKLSTDKKNIGGKLLFAVPSAIGQFKVNSEFSSETVLFGLEELLKT